MPEAAIIRPIVREDLNGSMTLLGTANGIRVGMPPWQVVIPAVEGGPAVLIEDVVVREDRRGCGLKVKLVGAICRWAGETEVGRLFLPADEGWSPFVN